MGLLRAELRKLTSVRTTWVLSLVGWALAGLGAGLFVFLDDFTGAFTGSASQVADVIDQVGGASVLVLVVGVLSMTTEFRHGTAGRTLQITPSRSRVLAAKEVAGVLYAVAFFVVGVLVVGVIVLIGGAVAGVSLSTGPEVTEAVWQGLAGLTLTAVLGVAVGALLRSQVVAVTVSLVWVFMVEQLVAQFWPEVGRWLPFQALNAMFVSEEVRAAMPDNVTASLLDPLSGLAVFLGYVVAAGAAAATLMRTRDV